MATEAGGFVADWIGPAEQGDHATTKAPRERSFDRVVRPSRGELAGVRGVADDVVSLSKPESLTNEEIDYRMRRVSRTSADERKLIRIRWGKDE